jgi:hypothetical protein
MVRINRCELDEREYGPVMSTDTCCQGSPINGLMTKFSAEISRTRFTCSQECVQVRFPHRPICPQLNPGPPVIPSWAISVLQDLPKTNDALEWWHRRFSETYWSKSSELDIRGHSKFNRKRTSKLNSSWQDNDQIHLEEYMRKQMNELRTSLWSTWTVFAVTDVKSIKQTNKAWLVVFDECRQVGRYTGCTRLIGDDG